MRGGRHNNRQNDVNEELETLSEDIEELQKANAEQRVALDVTNERMQKIMHVFDLIIDKLINAKFGKHVAMVIATTGQTAEEVIKTVGLTNGMPNMSKQMYVLWTSHREMLEKMATGSDEEKATAKKQLLGIVMRACEGKTNPGLVNQYLDKMATEYNNGRGKFQDELYLWKCDTAFSATQDFENVHFKAIVDMGDKCIPWIHEIIDIHPDPIVHALDVMFPGLMTYEGCVPLNEVCEAWSALLKLTHDQNPMVTPLQEPSSQT
jgi:hypothetical protein